MRGFFLKGIFIWRYKIWYKLYSYFYRNWLGLMGASIGKNTIIDGANFTWYHKVKIGSDCMIEKNVTFKYDGAFTEGYAIMIDDKTFVGTGCEFNISENIKIGNHCAIASGCKFIDHNHGFDNRDAYIGEQTPTGAPIFIADDVWLGANVVVLKGVNIGKGAIVAAGSVVNKSIAPYEIWGGIPARKIGERP